MSYCPKCYGVSLSAAAVLCPELIACNDVLYYIFLLSFAIKFDFYVNVFLLRDLIVFEDVLTCTLDFNTEL